MYAAYAEIHFSRNLWPLRPQQAGVELQFRHSFGVSFGVSRYRGRSL